MNKILILTQLVLGAMITISTLFIILIFLLTDNMDIKILSTMFVLIIVSLMAAMYVLFRNKFILFAEQVSNRLDLIINGKPLEKLSTNKETLISKIEMKIEKLSEVTQNIITQNTAQKETIQQMVSDISHQLRTPIANITMYSDTLINNHIPVEQEIQFLKIMQSQVKKLEFLVNILVKMSRLETGIIALQKKEESLFETIGQSLSSIMIKAEQKSIRLEVDCDKDILISHDVKWTIEALFNILDNAVKYTNEKGTIKVSVERWEMFTKIDIIDSGMGIDPSHVNDIFKRFYREPKVHSIEGVGIGLYITREIITQQGGYIKVKSSIGKGSIFSILLPNENK